MLLQNEEGEANQFRSFVGTASVMEEDGNSVDGAVEMDGGDRCSAGFVVAMIVFVAAVANP